MDFIPKTPHVLERAPEYRHWNIEAQPDHPETTAELVQRVAERVKFWPGKKRSFPEGALMVDVGEMQDDSTDITKAQSEMAAQQWVQNRGQQESWWLNLHKANMDLSEIFESKQPTEQFIVGREGGGKAIRVYNFSDRMNAQGKEDLLNFTDYAEQYFGDKAYDILHDIVIMDFPEIPVTLHDESELGVAGGHAPFELPGVIFIDSTLMTAEFNVESLDLTDRPFIKALWHEFGHKINQFGPLNRERLTKFAGSMGWDTKSIRRDWLRGKEPYENLAPYVPPVATRQDGVIKAGPAGSPTINGTRNFDESHADVTMHAALGSPIQNYLMPETRDAWLEHAADVRGEPIAVPLDGNPPIIERRTGSNILYPRAVLPEIIDVRGLPFRRKLARVAKRLLPG